MKNVWARTGNILYWLTWPGLYLLLNNSRRTRVVVYRDDKVLVVKGWLGDGSWSLPGGGLHINESVEDSAVRELKEETGLQVEPSRIKHIQDFRIKYNGISVNINAFSVKQDKSYEPKPQRIEILEAKWLTRSELLKMPNITPDARLILSKNNWR